MFSVGGTDGKKKVVSYGFYIERFYNLRLYSRLAERTVKKKVYNMA